VAYNQFSFWILIVAEAVFAFRMTKGIYTGKVSEGRRTYARFEEPVDYWWTVVYSGTGLLVLAWLLTRPEQQYRASVMPTVLLFMIALPCLFRLARGLQTASISIFGSTYHRRSAGGRYAATLLCYAAAVAIAVGGALIPWELRTEERFGAVVKPVVQAVRLQLAAHQSLPFRKVRVDTQSRLVCGEVIVEGRAHRFHGRAVGDAGQILLEGQHPDFEALHARACSTNGYVPR
jgi:hypothetical protein